MDIYSVKLKNKKEIAEDTISFEFEKPAGFKFIAGQYIVLTLLNVEGTDKTRSFSIASAPHEENFLITSRITPSRFKEYLKNLPLGSDVQIGGPYGKFTLPSDCKNIIVFLVGGIGITPVRSMVLQALHDKLPYKIFLFYSNRTPENSVFLEEFMAIKDKDFVFIPTMTELDKFKGNWKGERGFVDDNMLKNYITDFKESNFYIVGPDSFVSAMRKMLVNSGLAPEDIKVDNFGYL